MIQNKKPSHEIKMRIKETDKTIRTHFRLEKRKGLRKGIVPGNSSSLWKAVNLAKDLGMGGIPEQMHLGGVLVRDGLVPDVFKVCKVDQVSPPYSWDTRQGSHVS